MAGLAEIAQELNVSPSLISKVLSGRLGTTRVSAKTVRAIKARAEGLNFRQNASASALATGRQNVLGVFVHRMGVAGSGITDAMLGGISAEAVLHRQRLVIHFFESIDRFMEQRASLHRGVMDGLIVGGLNHKELAGILEEVQADGVPVVTVHDIQLNDHFCNVGMDQVEVGLVATRHLIARGCRRIAHIHRIEERLHGYQAALAEAGLPFADELVVKVDDFEHARGVEALEVLRTRGVAFDGIFAQSDQLAAGAMNALMRGGRRVPQDVKIIGVDDSPFCAFTAVPLSSISQEVFARGRRALQLLVERTASQETNAPAKSESFAPVLYERDSTQFIETP